MRGSVRSFVREHAAELVEWYAGDDPAMRTPEWFDQEWRSLTSYYGEDYGHWGDKNNLVLISELCFDGRPPRSKSAAAKHSKRAPIHTGFVAQSAPKRTTPPLAPVVVPFRDEGSSEGLGPVIMDVSDRDAAE
jgi:hypothetical protein